MQEALLLLIRAVNRYGAGLEIAPADLRDVPVAHLLFEDDVVLGGQAASAVLFVPEREEPALLAQLAGEI